MGTDAGQDDRTDAELLRATSPDAFSELYDRHAEAVLRFFMTRVGCAETAADLTAETFASAFSSRRRFRDIGAPGRAWLFTIARRQLNRFIRRERVADRARRRLGVRSLELTSLDIERMDAMVDARAMADDLRDALASLPEGQAAAVRLRIADDLTYAEVARELGCTEGAARVRVSRGLTSLADALESS